MEEEAKETLRSSLPSYLGFVFTELQKWPERPQQQVDVPHSLHPG